MIISIDVEKLFDKIQHQFMIKKKKTLSKLRGGKVPQLNKEYLQKTYTYHHT